MTGKTHLSVGMATGLMLMSPSGIAPTVLTMLSAGAGSLVSDLDADHSKAESMLESKKGWVSIGLMIALSLESGNFNIPRMALGALMIAVICFLGSRTPHRMFMHSVECNVLLSIGIYILTGSIYTAICFAVGMLSHTLIDLLNHKDVLVSALLKVKFCLHKCNSSSIVSTVMCVLGYAVIGLFIIGMFA